MSSSNRDQNVINRQQVHIIILAAGNGSRMAVGVPKVLNEVGGLPMLCHVIRAAKGVCPNSINVVASPKNMSAIEQSLTKYGDDDVNIFIQEQQLGTGDAIKPVIKSDRFRNVGRNDLFVVLLGDAPLITANVIAKLISSFENSNDNNNEKHVMSVIGMELSDPKHYGRLVASKGYLQKIVEYKDATESEKDINVCNSGVMAFRADALIKYIDNICASNKAGEYYLTDMVEIVSSQGLKVKIVNSDNAQEMIGVNTLEELSLCEKEFQRNCRKKMMESGVRMIDPDTVYFSYDTKVGKGCVILPHVYFDKDVVVEDNVKIGPFAHIRPGTRIADNAKIGNFVEVKNSNIGKGSKVNHLSYIGDSDIGENVNIGAGTITCNYDGYQKHKTVVKDNVMIGSNNSLVAPINIGENSITGAGSTLVNDVEDDTIAIARAEQKNLLGKAKSYRQKKKLGLQEKAS